MTDGADGKGFHGDRAGRMLETGARLCRVLRGHPQVPVLGLTPLLEDAAALLAEAQALAGPPAAPGLAQTLAAALDRLTAIADRLPRPDHRGAGEAARLAKAIADHEESLADAPPHERRLILAILAHLRTAHAIVSGSPASAPDLDAMTTALIEISALQRRLAMVRDGTRP